MCFLYADSFLLRVYYEDSVRDALHILDTAKVLLQLLPLFLQCDNFLLRQYIKGSVLRHLLDSLQTSDSALDGLEVGQHTAEPTLIYVEHTATLCLNLDSVLSLLLGSYEQDVATLCHDVKYCLVSLINLSYRLLQVDDVDAVTLCVDVRSHLGVPASCLMSEMNTCFQ